MRSIGVVLCNPIGYEALSVHRAYRHLGARLAANGIAALRFDYQGTGDSAGRGDEPGRVRAWTASIAAAVQELRARAPHVDKVALFGVRMGATLATLAARELGGVHALVLWAPVVSGKMHARELRAFALARARAAGASTRPATGGAGGDASVEIGGFSFGRDLLADIGAIDLGATATAGPLAERLLVLPRTERGGEEPAWVERLRAAGRNVELRNEAGYAAMMRDDPYFSVVPSEALDAIVGWLASGAASAPAAAPAPAPMPAAAPPLPPERSGVLAIPLAEVGRALHETPARFGPEERLFGVVTSPATAQAPDRPAVLLLNVGADQHVGPHRMNVDLARELASLGYLALRFDAAGLGDSLAAPGTPENRIYTKDAVGDTQAAMTMLAERHGARRFVLVGLCSGAFVAFHTAAADARVAGQVLISPFAFEWKEGDPVTPVGRKTYASTRAYLRGLLDPKAWRRAVRGEIDVRGIAAVLLERVHKQIDAELPALRALLRGRGRGRARNDVERAFVEMCERGVETMIVSAFNDGGLDMLAGYLGMDARRMRPYRTFDLQVVDDGDHTFTSVASQRTLHAIVARYLKTRFP